MISKRMKLADAVHMNYLLLYVIDRFGIKLGFGDKSVEEVCREYNLDSEFFIEIVNSFVDENYIPSSDINTFPTEQAVEYLKNTHTNYLEVQIPEIESLIHEMVQNCSLDKKNVVILNNFFEEYRQELETHIKREEEAVFPYVLKVTEAFRHQKVSKDLIDEMKEYSINDFASEHDNVEEKLYDLKNIIIKYLPPVDDPHLCHKILIELFNLEKDLNDHALLEDRLVVPIVAEKEAYLRKIYIQQ